MIIREPIGISISRFIKEFQREYLDEMKFGAEKVKKVAEDITSVLAGTEFATDSSTKLADIAEQILNAIQTEEERILEIERKTKQELDQLMGFNNCR